jgi:hypothetical protein
MCGAGPIRHKQQNQVATGVENPGSSCGDIPRMMQIPRGMASGIHGAAKPFPVFREVVLKQNSPITLSINSGGFQMTTLALLDSPSNSIPVESLKTFALFAAGFVFSLVSSAAAWI